MQARLTSVTPVILAGGKGTRLASVCPDSPKVIAPVDGRPFILFLIHQLAMAGFTDVVVSVGYMADRVVEALGERHGPLRIRYSREHEPLGTGGAVRLALELVKTDGVLVMNGDSYVEVDLPAYAAWHAGRSHDASLVLVEVPDTSRYGRVTVGEGGRVVAFEEKGRTGPGWINGGIYLFSRRYLGHVLPDGAGSLEKDTLPKVVSMGLHSYECRGRFIDIGTPSSYAEASTVLAGVWPERDGVTGV